MSQEIQRMADVQQYASEPMPQAARKGITVTLLNATPDPLGSLAALCAVYKGRVIRDLRGLSDADRSQALDDMLSTILNGPLAGVQFHFLVEGAGRDFTHQAVRDNFSFIAQESLRFAVKEDWAHEVPLPPSLAGLADDDPQVRMWRKALNGAEDAYGALVAAGMPAEDARKVLPHAVTTRYHWTPTLRTLLHEAGKRTCTQAQFEWRLMMAEIAKALRAYRSIGQDDGWQFSLIADRLRPVCYTTGKCEFKASFDRACSIRDRVDANARAGRPSTRWEYAFPERETFRAGDLITIDPIQPWEWAADPAAARVVAAPCQRCGGAGTVNYSSGSAVYLNAVECPVCKGAK